MSDGPNEDAILPNEIKEMFGDAVPLEIYNLMYNAHPGTTVGKLRSEIRKTAQEMFLQKHLLDCDNKAAISIFQSMGWEKVANEFIGSGKSSSEEEHIQESIRKVLITLVKQRLFGEKTGMERVLERTKSLFETSVENKLTLSFLEKIILDYNTLLFNFNNLSS